MNVYKMQSNQWSIGVGLRRSTIWNDYRWSLWMNHGFVTTSCMWSRNPARPEEKQ